MHSDKLILAAPEVRSGSGSSLYRAYRAGELIRLAEGVFIPASTWGGLSPDDRFLTRIHAVAHAFDTQLVFSHLSAAALWRLPMIGSWPDKPEVVVGRGVVGASRHGYTARRYEVPPPDEVDGVLVTPLARTLIDVGRTRPLAVSVAMVDAGRAVRGIPRAELHELNRSLASPRGARRCSDAIALSDAGSGSPGESLSRVTMHGLGLPAPVLQQEFRDARGLIGYVDFWWPQFRVVGEFDGRGKYVSPDILDGRTPAQVVVDEKIREDRLRALGITVTRWGWDTARSPVALGRQLAAAGVR
ncbi:MAG: hypothetical protein BGO97_15315 [Micrococcales bacterium 70-64]|nr:hypothetical protein [Leifsonia sp.]ODU65272.1 MAG: hypothetical protein ABT06_15315 [Leifsonia sp. SCN 70-46]OJX86963.1 MAG: hypothetical protein BGO97_15315 [Micrococcales bacterium 70-64]